MTSEITRIESMIQSAEDFGKELYKADECAEGIIGLREEKNETAGSLREVLSRVEAETTPRVLEMSRRVFSGYGNDEFFLNIHMHNEAEAGIPRLSPYDHVRAEGKKDIIRVDAYSAKTNSKIIAIINPNATRTRRKLIGIIPRKDRILDPNVNLGYRHDNAYYSDETCFPSKESFKRIAGMYSGIGEEKDILDIYVEMYAKLPQLIARIGEGLKRKEEAKKSELEKSLEKADKLAEGTK